MVGIVVGVYRSMEKESRVECNAKILLYWNSRLVLQRLGASHFIQNNQSGRFDWLQFYSHYFNCVEVNSTYYTYISPKIVEGWIRK